MKILIAPNSFKECANAFTAASILKEHLLNINGADIITFPVSDGGDGFLAVCKELYDLKIVNYKIPNLLNNAYKFVPVGYSDKEKKVYIEVAEVIGIKSVSVKKRKPLCYNTSPLGILLKKISWYNRINRTQLKKIVIGIGGTGTNDLGLGICSVFGLKLYDKNKTLLDIIPKNFIKTTKIILPRPYDIDINLIIDVEIKILGKNGTTYLFAKQKGVPEEELEGLENGVNNILNILAKDHKIQFTNKKIGAGGALSLGLSLLTKPAVISSVNFIQENLLLEEKIRNSDIVITGEGSFDNQSLLNKATGVVIKEAIKQKKKIILIAGSADRAVIKKLDYKINVIELNKYFANKEESIRKFGKGLKLAAEVTVAIISGIL